MEELYAVLEDCCPAVDFRTEKHLVDDGLLESLDIVMIVSQLGEEFGVHITVNDLLPENFNSAEAIWALVERLRGEN
ncbi:MAG: acyl carrier protein [Oscillospiraceae bacterium]|nr:acyl carrier protein [Oscillospiraceae bacterium]